MSAKKKLLKKILFVLEHQIAPVVQGLDLEGMFCLRCLSTLPENARPGACPSPSTPSSEETKTTLANSPGEGHRLIQDGTGVAPVQTFGFRAAPVMGGLGERDRLEAAQRRMLTRSDAQSIPRPVLSPPG